MALPLLLQYPRTTKGILEFLPLDKVWMKIFLTITNLTGQGLTNRCIYWRPVRMLLEPLNPKFHSGFEALCLCFNASFIEASIVNRTWTFCALQVQPLIFWDVIQSIHNLILYILPNLYSRWYPVIFSTRSIPTPVSDQFKWAQSYCVLKYFVE